MESIKENENSVHLFISNLTLGEGENSYQEILRTHYEDLLRGGHWFRNEISLEEHCVDGRKRLSVKLDGEKIGDLIGSEVDMYDVLKKSGRKMYLQIDIQHSQDYYESGKVYVPSIYCLLD